MSKGLLLCSLLCRHIASVNPFQSTRALTDVATFSLLHRKEQEGVVTFVSEHVPVKSKIPLVCPKATSPQEGQRLSPLDEEQGEDDDSSTAAAAAESSDTPNESGDEENESAEDNDEEEQDDYILGGPVVSEPEVHGSPDIELKDILDSLGDVLDCSPDESESSNYQYIGVAEDAGHRHFDFVTTFPKSKRVLSYNTLFALNREAGHSSDETKRVKRTDLKDVQSSAPTTLLSTFSLGPPALRSLPPLRDESPVISDSDDLELDRQLGSELNEHDSAEEERNETPVPLLTPPASPLTIEVDGNPTTVCEWPSNLTVDSAMQAVNELRPMSPASLETLERNEQDRMASRIDNITSTSTTALTPLLQSVNVG